MGRMYTAQFNAVAVTAAQDLFELNCPSDAVVVVHEIGLSQTTELGDAAEEQLKILMKKGATSSGSGGSTPTATPVELGDAAFGGTVEANNTTQASGGTITTLYAWAWNVRTEFQKIFTPETRPVISPSARLTIETNAPADSVTMNGYIVFEEIGG